MCFGGDAHCGLPQGNAEWDSVTNIRDLQRNPKEQMLLEESCWVKKRPRLRGHTGYQAYSKFLFSVITISQYSYRLHLWVCIWTQMCMCAHTRAHDWRISHGPIPLSTKLHVCYGKFATNKGVLHTPGHTYCFQQILTETQYLNLRFTLNSCEAVWLSPAQVSV